ncbi:MAG TPA: EAL domain-containing protein [Burkholderiaceae bacterium]|nr:EAL domain-containing protein [Burkholderiaceae bacterium]
MPRNRWPFSLSAAAAITLVMGLAGTVALFAGVRRYEYHRAELDFMQRANVQIAAVQEGLRGAVQALESTNRLFATVDTVSRAQFHTFTQSLLARYPYIQAFNFHRFVAAEQLPAYVAAMRRRYPDFIVNEMYAGKIIPARPKQRYVIVDYLEPMQGNEAALGLDVSPNLYMAQELQRAIDTGLPSATDLLWIAQGKGSRSGFLVLMPVYRHGVPLRDIAARRSAAIGDTAAVFRVGDLVEQILTDGGFIHSSAVNVSVYASSQPDDRELIFRHGLPLVATRTIAWIPDWIWHDDTVAVSRNFDVAGKTWTMVLSSQPMWFAATNRIGWLALVAGILFTLLAAAYLQSVFARAQRIQQLVDQRTAELKEANRLLGVDIAARERAEQALRLRERAIESSANAIFIINADAPDYRIEYVNPAFERITGHAFAAVTGQCLRFLYGSDMDQPGIEEIRAALRDKREGRATLRNHRTDGALFWSDIYIAPVKDRSGGISHFVMTQYDISATKRYEAELEFQANQDMLTGLANRNLLRDRLRQAIAYAARYGHAIWVVFADLDRFKLINDTLGYQAGDALLKEVAKRLLLAVRDTDTVARLGGDEFVLVLPERNDERLTMIAVQRIMDVLAQPLTIEGHEFFPTCSVGVAVFPDDGEDPDTLVKHAEIAMYRAKETGRNNFQFFTAALNEKALDRLRLETDLRKAVERDEFVLHYQPQVDLKSGRMVGMEALIRWQHPERGMVSPARFIGLAEETGLIVPIGQWVIRTACLQNKAWQEAGLGHLRVAVNLSARQFNERDLLQTITTILQETGLDAQYLEVELTESLVMTEVERAIAILRDLKALGLQISIDDFGTGYSSLSYLKRFPIDVLKIDQSFVRDITTDPDDAAIVMSIISLAHNLRLHVIAEGVETETQLTYLRENSCDQIQGYYFSRPLAADAFRMLLEQNACLPNQVQIPTHPIPSKDPLFSQ